MTNETKDASGIKMMAQNSCGAILSEFELDLIDSVYIFLTKVNVELRRQHHKWEVAFCELDKVKQMCEHNRNFCLRSVTFDSKLDAEIFADQKRALTQNQLNLCVREGGIVVTPHWLYTCVTPPQLKRHFRIAKPFCSEKYNQNEMNQMDIDPYFLGLWLGDGTSANANITTMDIEIVNYLQHLASKFPGGWKWIPVADRGKAKTYTMRDGLQNKYKTNERSQQYKQPFSDFMKEHPHSTTKEIQTVIPIASTTVRKWRKEWEENEVNFIQRTHNPLKKQLFNLNLLKNKHIPKQFFQATRQIKLQVLAGLLDTDGWLQNSQYLIAQKSIQLSNDIQRLVTELGFFVYRTTKLAICTNGVTEESKIGMPVEKMTLSGLNLDQIPCLLPRKQMKQQIQSHVLPQIAFSDSFVKCNRKRTIQWTEEQDLILKQKIQKKECGWGAILQENAILFAGLSRDNIRDRYKKLQKISKDF